MKRIPIVILLTALLIGAFLFFDTCSTSTQTFKPDIESVNQTAKKVNTIDKQYENSSRSVKIKSDSLKKEIKQTGLKLKKVKAKLKESKDVLATLVKKDTAKVSVAKQLTDCDSLKKQFVLFALLSDSTHSIYEENKNQLENLLAIKDSELIICASSYIQLKSFADENLERERKLTKELQIAYKQQRRKTIQNKFLATGFLILSGISTTLYISSIK